ISLLMILVILFLKFNQSNLHMNMEKQLLASFLIYIFAELLTPAVRNPYNMIQYLGILGILVKQGTHKSIFLAVFGLALNHNIPFVFPYNKEIGEVLVIMALYFSLY